MLKLVGHHERHFCLGLPGPALETTHRDETTVELGHQGQAIDVVDGREMLRLGGRQLGMEREKPQVQYADILERAFERRPGTGAPPSVNEATGSSSVAGAGWPRRTRNRLAGWAASAVANQVAYDVALIELARCLGIACDPATFDRPALRRNELDRQLADRGVRLDRVATTESGWRGG